ncbi:MAG: hypothetical protein OEM03_11940 [Chromatiales bacterium]|nr:hypothetical protein [Chromatiales bacterium]
MRKLIFLLPLILAGCGSDGIDIVPSVQTKQHEPQITSLDLSPRTAVFMEGDGSISVTVEFDYADSGRDISDMHVHLSDGTSYTVSLTGIDTAEAGTHAEQLDLPTTMIGPYTVDIWLVDKAGDSSNHFSAVFDVIGELRISAGGIWNGTFSNGITGESFEASGVVTEDNAEGRFLVNGDTLFVLRDILAYDGKIVASISVSNRPESEFLPYLFEISGVMTGVLVERTRIEGEWSLDIGGSGTMTLEYDEIYERGADLTRLAGIWKTSWDDAYSIDALGEIFSQAENGCVTSGQVQIIDPAYNVYRVDIINWCLPYSASGLAALGDDVGTDDAFFLMVGEGWFIFDVFKRQ